MHLKAGFHSYLCQHLLRIIETLLKLALHDPFSRSNSSGIMLLWSIQSASSSTAVRQCSVVVLM